ncbi:MAG TPA: hypothetical protein DCO86_03900 [Spirochaetaceae bacterium]|nr:hypothetical protein [Spirochaetaceae bacterium]
MRRNVFLCVALLLACLAGLSAQSLTIKNPGDVKVYHKNGDSFDSPTRPNMFGVIPDTTMIEGDAIQTKRQSLTFKLDNSTIVLAPDSLMSFYRLSDKQNVLYLLRGELNISNAYSRNESREYVVLTPTSRFSLTGEFSARVVSSDFSEAIHVSRGNALAFNYITEENAVVKERGYVDFLEDISDNIVAVVGDLESLPAPGIAPAEDTSANRQYGADEAGNDANSVKDPAIVSAFVTETSNGKVVSQKSVPADVQIVQAEPQKQGDVNLNIQIQQPNTPAADADSGKTIINRYYNDYYYYYDKDGKLVMSNEVPPGATPVSKDSVLPSNFNVNVGNGPAQPTSVAPDSAPEVQSLPALVNDSNKSEVFVKADSGGVVSLGGARVEIPAGALAEDAVVSIEAISDVSDSDKAIENTTGNARGYRFLPSGKFKKNVRVTVPYDRSLSANKEKLDDMRTYFYDEDAQEWKALQRVAIDEVNCTITSLTDHFTDMINAIIRIPGVAGPAEKLSAADESDSRLKLNSWHIGVDLGVESAFDGSNAEDKKPSPLGLFIKPYTRIVNSRKGVLFDLKLNLEVDYAYDETNNKYTFSFPQIDLFKNKTLSTIGSITQFIDDLVVPGTLYISRNYDLPLEYNNLTLRKHNSDHNVYQTYHYASNDGERVYDDPISFSRKLPGLLDVRIGEGFRFRAFADDLDRLMRYRKNPTDSKQYWRRDDDSVIFGELVMNISPVIFGVGGMYLKGGWTAGAASDPIFLTAKAGTDKLISNMFTGFNVALPLMTMNWTTDSNSPNIKFFSDIAKKFMIGFSMNTKVDNIIFDFGADFSKGMLFTGLLNKHKVFDDNSLYTTGIGDLLSIYPYVNADFDFGNFSLLLNLDIPVMFGKAGTDNMLSTLTSWSNKNFLYRLNGGAAIRFKLAGTMDLNVEYDMEDLLPNRGAYLRNGTSFKDYLSENKFSLLNLIPQFSCALKDGPIQIKILARHQRVNAAGAINTKYAPIVSFTSSISIGNDYLFNKTYAAKRSAFKASSEEMFRIVFNVDTKFESFKYVDGEEGYTAFTISPRVGLKYKSLSLVAKFDVENFNIPVVLRNGGTIGAYIDTFIDELDLVGFFKIGRISGITEPRRSVLFEPSYERNLSARLRLFKFMDINIADFPEFIDGLKSNSKKAYADISLGWIDYESMALYVNYIMQMAWGGSFTLNKTNPISLNFAIRSDNLFIGMDAVTTLGYENKKLEFGLKGGVSNWNALADVGFGYSKKNAFDFIVRLGVQNGSLVYNQYDHLTNVDAGNFTNVFSLTDKNGAAFMKFSQFVDATINLHLGVGFDLNLGYNLPMALFDSASKGLLRDRARAKISFSYNTIDLYGLFEKRGVIAGNKGWGFTNIDDVAFKLGVSFKSDYATFALEAISSHFIYGPTESNAEALPDAAQRRAFSINLGVSFGFY